MNSCSINVVETIFKKKLELVDKALDRLPSGIQPAVRGLQTLALTSLRDSLDQYLKNDRSSKESTLKKIDLE